MHKIELTNNQAKEFAYNIYKDIPLYIKEHHKEYNKYLNEQKGGIYE